MNSVARSARSASRMTALRARAAKIQQLEIDFIASSEFEKMLAAKTILAKFEPVARHRPRSRPPTDQAQSLNCLAPALNEPLLSFAEEQHEFRRMNYLKFIATRLRDSLSLARPSELKLARIENCLAEAGQVRNHIIRCNLRLVVANAGKYYSSIYGFEDLVSDGSLALMQAVDKFDYQRGFRFSTYATHAIRRSFFRRIEQWQRERERFVATDPDLIAGTAGDSSVDYDSPAENRLIQHLLGQLPDHLTEREQHIVEGRYGLNGRSQPCTLTELSGELGICKERVRQLEGLALRKLHAAAQAYAPQTEVLAETTL